MSRIKILDLEKCSATFIQREKNVIKDSINDLEHWKQYKYKHRYLEHKFILKPFN